MRWLREQARQGMKPRTYVLLGILLVALVTAHSMEQQTRRARSRTHGPSGGAPLPAPLAPTASKPGPTTPTEPGWGSDPFRRRFAPDE